MCKTTHGRWKKLDSNVSHTCDTTQVPNSCNHSSKPNYHPSKPHCRHERLTDCALIRHAVVVNTSIQTTTLRAHTSAINQTANATGDICWRSPVTSLLMHRHHTKSWCLNVLASTAYALGNFVHWLSFDALVQHHTALRLHHMCSHVSRRVFRMGVCAAMPVVGSATVVCLGGSMTRSSRLQDGLKGFDNVSRS